MAGINIAFDIDTDLDKETGITYPTFSIAGVGHGGIMAYRDKTDTKEYKDIYELEKVKIIEDYLVLKDKYKLYKGVFYNDLFSNVTFNYDNLELSLLNTEVIGVPCNFKMQDITYEENYDPLIFGVYSICFNYKYFMIQSKIEVLERSNIVDGNIYPTGYNIFFSGVAYLNGEEIYNNHELVEEGEYSLNNLGYFFKFTLNPWSSLKCQ